MSQAPPTPPRPPPPPAPPPNNVMDGADTEVLQMASWKLPSGEQAGGKVTAFAKVIFCPHLRPLHILIQFVAISLATLYTVICLTLTVVSNIYHAGVQEKPKVRRVSF